MGGTLCFLSKIVVYVRMNSQIRRYKKPECVVFKSTKGKFGGLSNMAPGYPIVIGDHMIPTVEALYQALRFPDSPEIQKHIISFKSPISAKKYGRLHIEKTRPDWDSVKFKIMKFCIALKLYQNREKFSNVLLSTSDMAIVEYSEKDKIWGAVEKDGYYIGINALGRLLMDLREKLKDGSYLFLVPNIENLKFLDNKIEIDCIPLTSNSHVSTIDQLILNFDHNSE